MTDRHLGLNAWAYREQFPWLTMPSVTDAWIADAKYLDTTGSVGLWKPQKGVIQLVQGTAGSKPVYSAAWGSRNLGMLTFDGVDDWISGDALSAKATGLQAYVMIASFQALAVASIHDVWAYSHNSNTASGTALQIGLEAGNPWRAALQDDAAVSRVGVSDFPADTTKVVITQQFNGSSNWTMRINGVPRTLAHGGSAPGTTTFSKFTLGAHRGSSAIALLNMNLRGVLRAASMSLSDITLCENALIAGAA